MNAKVSIAKWPVSNSTLFILLPTAIGAKPTTIVPEINQRFNLKICACLSLLTPGQARDLKACGVDRVNHKLNTSEQYYGEICTSHTFAGPVATLHAVRDAGH